MASGSLSVEWLWRQEWRIETQNLCGLSCFCICRFFCGRTVGSDLLHLESVCCCTVHSKRIGPKGFYEFFLLYGHVCVNNVELKFFFLPDCIFRNALLRKILRFPNCFLSGYEDKVSNCFKVCVYLLPVLFLISGWWLGNSYLSC